MYALLEKAKAEVQVFVLLEEHLVLKLHTKKSKTSNHRKNWLICSNSNNYCNSKAFLTYKMAKI